MNTLFAFLLGDDEKQRTLSVQERCICCIEQLAQSKSALGIDMLLKSTPSTAQQTNFLAKNLFHGVVPSELRSSQNALPDVQLAMSLAFVMVLTYDGLLEGNLKEIESASKRISEEFSFNLTRALSSIRDLAQEVSHRIGPPRKAQTDFFREFYPAMPRGKQAKLEITKQEFSALQDTFEGEESLDQVTVPLETPVTVEEPRAREQIEISRQGEATVQEAEVVVTIPTAADALYQQLTQNLPPNTPASILERFRVKAEKLAQDKA